MPKCVSYIRFSSASQAGNDSIKRQTEASERWAAEHDMVLSDLTFRDLGVSAFKGKNRNDGQLGAFLQAIKEGEISSSDVLLVESIDRLSRAAPLTAFDIIREIIKTGVKIVTLSDGQVYDTKELNESGGKIFILFAIIQRSHDESKMKSLRVRSALAAKKKRILDGERVRHHCPNWLRYDDDDEVYHVIEERGRAVKAVYDLAVKGMGDRVIVREMTEQGPEPFNGERWTMSAVRKMLKTRTTVGEMTVDGEVVENYYPAVVEEAVWTKAAELRATRTYQTGTKKEGDVNLFTGLARCECGSVMSLRTVNKKTKKGRKTVQHFVCFAKKSMHGVCTAPSMRYNHPKVGFLDRFLSLMSNTLDVESLIAGDEKTNEAGAEMHDLSLEMVGLDKKIKNLEAACENYDGDNMRKFMAGMSKRIDGLFSKKQDAERRLGSLLAKNPASVDSKTVGESLSDAKRIIEKMFACGDEEERLEFKRRLRIRITELVDHVRVNTDDNSFLVRFRTGAMYTDYNGHQQRWEDGYPGKSWASYGGMEETSG